jgi:hypothetical protein
MNELIFIVVEWVFEDEMVPAETWPASRKAAGLQRDIRDITL